MSSTAVSAAPATPISGAGGLPFKRPSTLTAYRWELRKLISQKRTYLGLGLAAILPLIFVLVQNLHHHEGHDHGQHLRLAHHPVGPGDAGADAAVPVGLHAAADRRAGRRGHRRGRGRQRHAEDDPHALGRPRPGVRREGARGDDLRGDRGVPVGCRGDDRRRRLVGLSPRRHLLRHRSSPRRKACCWCSPPTPAT